MTSRHTSRLAEAVAPYLRPGEVVSGSYLTAGVRGSRGASRWFAASLREAEVWLSCPRDGSPCADKRLKGERETPDRSG